MRGGLALSWEWSGVRERTRGRRVPEGLVVSLVGSLVTLAVLLVASLVLIHRVAEDTALDHAAGLAAQTAEVALAPSLTDALLDGDPAAVAAFERSARALVAGDHITHLKVWDHGGRVAWADRPSLIGQRFELGIAELRLFGTSDWTASVSELDAPENALDGGPDDTRLLEVYFGAATVEGNAVVVELYAPYDLVDRHATGMRNSFVPLMVVVLLVLAAAQLALVLVLGRRLARSERRRSRLLQRMIETSDAERRRVAAEVHDGVVQDLVGVSLALSAVGDGDGGARSDAAARADAGDVPSSSQLAAVTARAVASLRGLLSSIYPVSVPPEGWVAGLVDLVDGLRRLGVVVSIDAPDVPLGAVDELLLLRVAREGLRNVASHAAAGRVWVRLVHRGDRLELAITDDGRGFDPASDRAGHFGLTLVRDLVEEAGGTVVISSAPGSGTTLRCELRVAS